MPCQLKTVTNIWRSILPPPSWSSSPWTWHDISEDLNLHSFIHSAYSVTCTDVISYKWEIMDIQNSKSWI